MGSRDFCYWLQGLFELSESTTLTEKQVRIIKNHLKLVFLYEIDPSYSDDPDVQKLLQNVHDGRPEMDGIEKKVKKHGVEIFDKDYDLLIQ